MPAAVFACAVGAVCAGCVPKATIVTESDARFSPSGPSAVALLPADPALAEPIQLTEATAVVDVRRPFDFASSRIPRSISLQWSDFSQALPAQKGVLQLDLFQIARRLARQGIAPDTPVVVVGYGLKGSGEEGRMAWMLRYLGVQSVRFAGLTYFPGPFTSRNPFPGPEGPGRAPGEPSPRNAPIWMPNVDPSWIATRDEVREVIARGGQQKAVLAGSLLAPKLYALIDVRLMRDSTAPSAAAAGPTAITLPWSEFVDKNGRPECSAVRKLVRLGATPAKRLIVFDELGLASGGAVVALRACGYSDVANYAGGLRDLAMPKPSFGTAPNAGP